MVCPLINESERFNIQARYKFILHPLTRNLDKKAKALQTLMAYLAENVMIQETDSVAAARTQLHNFTMAPKLFKNEAGTNGLRDVVRALFPTPADYAAFMRQTMFVPDNEWKDELIEAYSLASIIYLSACAQTISRATLPDWRAPAGLSSWASLASALDLVSLFGSEWARTVHGTTSVVEPAVRSGVAWPGEVIDMAVRLERWTKEASCTDPWDHALAKFLGII